MALRSRRKKTTVKGTHSERIDKERERQRNRQRERGERDKKEGTAHTHMAEPRRLILSVLPTR